MSKPIINVLWYSKKDNDYEEDLENDGELNNMVDEIVKEEHVKEEVKKEAPVKNDKPVKKDCPHCSSKKEDVVKEEEVKEEDIKPKRKNDLDPEFSFPELSNKNILIGGILGGLLIINRLLK